MSFRHNPGGNWSRTLGLRSDELKLELDSTMSQSWFVVKSISLGQLSLVWKCELNWMSGCWEKFLWVGGGWQSKIESLQVLRLWTLDLDCDNFCELSCHTNNAKEERYKRVVTARINIVSLSLKVFKLFIQLLQIFLVSSFLKYCWFVVTILTSGGWEIPRQRTDSSNLSICIDDHWTSWHDYL